jgi:hypothetical protein
MAIKMIFSWKNIKLIFYGFNIHVDIKNIKIYYLIYFELKITFKKISTSTALPAYTDYKLSKALIRSKESGMILF